MQAPTTRGTYALVVDRIFLFLLLLLLFSVACRDPSPPAPVDAFAPPREPMLPHAESVASYTLTATLDPDAHVVTGEGTLVFRNVSDAPLSEVWFHLYLNAFKNQRSVFLREPVGGFRGAAVPEHWGTIDVTKLTWRDPLRADLLANLEVHRNDDDETDARVLLPRPLLPGESCTFEMAWRDQLPSIVERTGFDGSFHMVGQWFPKIAKLNVDGTFAHYPFHHLAEFAADFGTYDVTLKTPERFRIAAAGPTVEQRIDGGERTERHVQADIHDFAWSAWDHFDTRSEVIDGVDVTVWFPAGDSDVAERELETLRFAIPYFGERFGPYPYPVLGVVHPPSTANEAGGMEYPTLITTGQAGFTPRGLWLPEIVTLHEFGHQYFYGLLASDEYAWPFLDEGLNTLAEAEAMEAFKGKNSAVDILGLRVGDAEVHAESARHYAHDEPVAQGADRFSSGSAYGSLVYSRTYAIFETVRRAYGRQAFDETLGIYTRRFRFRHPTPGDLLSTFRESLGAKAETTLRTALFDRGWVDYSVASIGSEPATSAAGIFDVAGKRDILPSTRDPSGGWVGSVLVVRRGTLNVPTEVELISANGERTRSLLRDQGSSVRIAYHGSTPLRFAVIDPDGSVVIDSDPKNNFAIASDARRDGPARTFDFAAAAAEAILGSVLP